MKLNVLSRRIRLMPAVIVVGTGLLVMKTSGLVHEAQAAEANAAPVSQTAQIDFAGPAEQNASASEVDILTNLSQRRDALDARARDLDMRANLLAAAEKRVDDKIAQIKDLQTQLATLLKQRDAEQEKQIQSLVKTYSDSKMKAKAAQVFATLDDEVLVPVAQEMKPEDLAQIMNLMPTDAAQKLTVKLANRLALPKTAPPPAMAPVAAAPVPGQQSDATPQPVAPDAAPAQKQAAIAPSPIDAKTPPATKPVQVAAKAPATTPAAAAPAPVAAAKPAAKVAATTSTKPQAKTDAKVDAKADVKTDAPAPETPTAPPAPAAPPGPAE